MMWISAALAYCAAYVVAVSLAGDADTRLRIADAGLLLSPLLPIIVITCRRRAWNGRALIYWLTLAAGCAAWTVGHIGWTLYELRGQALPWLEWPVALKLTGGVMPVIGLIAWPNRRIRGGSLAIVVLDIAGVTVVCAFLFWSLIVAPGLAPSASPVGLRSLAVVSWVLHAGIVSTFIAAALSVEPGPWRTTYGRLAIGAGAGSVLLILNAGSMAAGTYATGAIGDVGWIVPFWCYAWAAWDAPQSPAVDSSPMVNWTASTSPSRLSPALLVPVLIPIVGYAPRLLAPLGSPIDRVCDMVTSITLVGALGLTLVRVGMEQRARHRADYRLWLLATACEQSSDFIVIIRDRVIEYANDAFQRAFGYSLSELRAMPPQKLVAPASQDAVNGIVAALRRGQVARARVTLLRRDETTFEGRCSVTGITTASGRAACFVGVIHDLTDELQRQDRLVQHERLSAIGDALAGVAHEISNPLQSAMGLAELVHLEQLDTEARADLDLMRAEIDRAARVIRGVHAFLGRAHDRSPIDLNEAARRVIAMRARELSRHGVRVETEFASDLPRVFGSRDDLEQAIWQLVVNAEEAIARGGGGVLTVRTAAGRAGATVALDVADDGPGVPPIVAARLFEPFVSTKQTGGQGLGLAIALGIVTAHQGSLSLVPNARGACFRITLPAKRRY